MTQRAARITQHEAERMVKAVRGCGVSILKITFDGERLEIYPDNGDIGDKAKQALEIKHEGSRLLREPK